MRKKFLLMPSFILAIILVVAGCGGTDSTGGNNNNSDEDEAGDIDSEEVIEMNVNNWNQSTHQYAYNVLEPWKDMVEEKTDGRVKVNLYHGASLGAADNAYEDLQGGVYDVGLIVATYYYDSELFPYTIGNLPFAFPDPESATEVMTKFGEKYAQDAFDDIHYMGGVTTTDPYHLFAKKPITTVEDTEGLKMRVQGKSDRPLVEDWGASPVSFPNSEMYESLQKGTLDTVFYTPSGAVSYKLPEVAPYITEMGITVTPLIPAMSNDFYNQLSDDLKEMFDDELGPKLVELYVDGYMKEIDEAKETLIEEVEGEGEYIELDQEELEDFSKSAESVWEAWVEDANDKGYPGEEMMKEFKNLLEEEGLEIPF